jgi:hypothetical protein
MADTPLNTPQTVNTKVDEILSIVRSQKAPEPIPLIDPTANVLKLVEQAMLRQDDLRRAESSRINDLMELQDKCTHEISDVRLKAQEALASAESRRIDALSIAESRRIDALFAASASAVALDRTRTEMTASALAERVDTSAKALAASVIASAEALSKQVATQSQVFDQRLTRLEQQGYETGGRDVQRVESRAATQWSIGTAIAALSGFMAFVSIVVYALVHH